MLRVFRIRPLLFLSAAVLAWASFSYAARKAHELKWALCFKRDVSVCTELIDSGEEGTSNLAIDSNNRGHAYSLKGEYDKAIKDYSEAIRLDPKNYSAYSNRGTDYARKAEYDAAMHDFNTALQLAPDYAAALNNRATLYTNKHEYLRAIRDYDRAIIIRPDTVSFYCNRSALKRQIGDKLGADADAAKARSLGETAECIIQPQCPIPVAR